MESGSDILDIISTRKAAGEQHHLSAIRGPQFPEDDGHMGLDRGLGDLKILTDLLIEPSGAEHAEDPKLLRSQLRDALRDLELVRIGLPLRCRRRVRNDLAAQDR